MAQTLIYRLSRGLLREAGDDLVLVPPTTLVAAGDWTPSTGTDLVALVADDDDDTYITSGTPPDAVTFGWPALETPTGEVAIVIRHRLGS